MFAIDWENPQLTKSGLDFRDWELILEHKNEVCLTLWPIEGEAEVCESQITVWPLMFSPLVCRVISPGTVCRAAVCGWGQCPSRASQNWSEPAYRKWLFISCSRTVTWAVRSPFPKVRPHFAIPWGMLPVKQMLCQSYKLQIRLSPTTDSGRKLQLLGHWLEWASSLTNVFNKTVYMSTNMFIKRKIDGALKGKVTCISTVYMASAQPVKKNFQKSPLKGLEEKPCLSQYDFKITSWMV